MLDANVADKTCHIHKPTGRFGNGTKQADGQTQFFDHNPDWFYEIGIVGKHCGYVEFSLKASRTRWLPRFTSLPFSSVFQTFATSGNGGMNGGTFPPRNCGGCTNPDQGSVTKKPPRWMLISGTVWRASR